MNHPAASYGVSAVSNASLTAMRYDIGASSGESDPERFNPKRLTHFFHNKLTNPDIKNCTPNCTPESEKHGKNG